MLDDESLMSSIEQTIDALTFSQTHVIDADFRAHSKSTLDSVLSLQEDQRNRVEHAFRGIRPSPAFLAQHLLSAYRGESASVSIAKESSAAPSANTNNSSEGTTAIDLMSDNKCRAFKKEMKQRIHEWEGAFREQHGRDAAPQDKAPLRPVYELYKHAKARVVQAGDSGAATPLPGGGGGTPQPQTFVTPATDERYSSGGLRSTASALGSTNNNSASYNSRGTVGAYSDGGRPPSSLSTNAPVTPTQPATVAQRNSGSGVFTQRPSSADPPPSPNRQPINTTSAGSGSSQYHHNQQQQQSPSPAMQGTTTSSSTPTNMMMPATAAAGVSSSTPANSNNQNINLDEILNEKRRIKRTLHQFEAAFEAQNGRKPTRDDRKEFNAEYHRYGELKALLNEMGRGND